MTSRRRHACTLTSTYSSDLDERSWALSAFASAFHRLPTFALTDLLILMALSCLKYFVKRRDVPGISHKHDRKREREVASSVLP